jgi:hypothetical protein
VQNRTEVDRDDHTKVPYHCDHIDSQEEEKQKQLELWFLQESSQDEHKNGGVISCHLVLCSDSEKERAEHGCWKAFVILLYFLKSLPYIRLLA